MSHDPHVRCKQVEESPQANSGLLTRLWHWLRPGRAAHRVSQSGKTLKVLNAKRWKPDESAACAHLRNGQLLLHGSSITQIGSLNCPPYQLLPGNITDEQLGAALLEILVIARSAPPPSDSAAEQKKLFAIAGVKSWKQLNDGAVYCYLGMSPNEITIIPTRTELRGSAHLPDKGLKVAPARPSNLERQFAMAFRAAHARAAKGPIGGSSGTSQVVVAKPSG